MHRLILIVFAMLSKTLGNGTGGNGAEGAKRLPFHCSVWGKKVSHESLTFLIQVLINSKHMVRYDMNCVIKEAYEPLPN